MDRNKGDVIILKFNKICPPSRFLFILSQIKPLAKYKETKMSPNIFHHHYGHLLFLATIWPPSHFVTSPIFSSSLSLFWLKPDQVVALFQDLFSAFFIVFPLKILLFMFAAPTFSNRHLHHTTKPTYATQQSEIKEKSGKYYITHVGEMVLLYVLAKKTSQMWIRALIQVRFKVERRMRNSGS